MQRSHVCTHPSGKSHVCGCTLGTSHGSFQIDCNRYANTQNVAKVDPTEESSHFVKVVEMPSAAGQPVVQMEAVAPTAPISIWVKMNGEWIEYVPRSTVA